MKNPLGKLKNIKNPLVQLKDVAKNAYINMPEQEYSKNARKVTGNLGTSKEVNKRNWDTMANAIKSKIRKVKKLF